MIFTIRQLYLRAFDAHSLPRGTSAEVDFVNGRKDLFSTVIDDGSLLRKLLHEAEKLFRFEALKQRGASSDFPVVSGDETNTLTGLPFSNNSGQFQTFVSVWTVRLKMLHMVRTTQ